MARERISKFLNNPSTPRKKNLKESRVLSIEEIEEMVECLCDKIRSFARMYGAANLQAIDDYIENFGQQGQTSQGIRATNSFVPGPATPVKERIKHGAKELLNEHLEQELNIGTPGNPALVPPIPGMGIDPAVSEAVSKITNMNI